MITAEEIEQQLHGAGIDALPPAARGQFVKYLELLLRWNRVMNLTSIRDTQELIGRHFVECAFAAQQLPAGISTLLDFGSGAGFPGIPIAICRPEIHVVLAESRSKKAAFLSEAVRTLSLESEVYGKRVEAMPQGRAFDAVALRAVDRMGVAISSARPRAKHVLALFAAQDGTSYRQLAPEFAWRKSISLPPGEQAILMIGERS